MKHLYWSYTVLAALSFSINACSDSSFSSSGSKAPAASKVPELQPTPTADVKANPEVSKNEPDKVLEPDPCVEKVLVNASVYVDGKMQKYDMIGVGNGSAPIAVPGVVLKKDNWIKITSDPGTMYYTWNSGPAVPSACPYGIVANEVKTSGQSLQSADANVYSNGFLAKEDDTVLYLGYHDTYNWYHDNSGGCTVKVEVKDKKCG